jgi:ring-1,2-phenylacetyl-CoA epoxidase subunit PaaD
MVTLTLEELETIAGDICDPELPPLTLADLGILRSVEHVDGTVIVTVTPTYSGCPAVEFIEDEIRSELTLAGCNDVQIVRAFSPTWTTDWITPEGRRKLTEAGIAPPRHIMSDKTAAGALPVPVVIGRRPIEPVTCPRCGGTNTIQISQFGSTACKSLQRCDDCCEPFDHFKEI